MMNAQGVVVVVVVVVVGTSDQLDLTRRVNRGCRMALGERPTNEKSRVLCVVDQELYLTIRLAL